ncbi:MAG: hypothetical protein HY791_27960 [Deltaproteobacteria bacterium]|nr:hypothetical protein [Deltaproteobacteria bacterium]
MLDRPALLDALRANHSALTGCVRAKRPDHRRLGDLMDERRALLGSLVSATPSPDEIDEVVAAQRALEVELATASLRLHTRMREILGHHALPN